ncbi:MAG: ABC transporter permease subunit [Caldilineales bacterium]|nr:ABC transporter permease subunit [Caldilineales bacterium]
MIGFFLIWEAAARLGLVSSLFFPAPSVTLRTLGEYLISGELFTDLSLTLSRLLGGMLIGGGVGLALGLLMGWSRKLRTVADPLIAAIHPIPKIAILPLILIIFGIGEQSKIVLVAIACFFPMFINTMTGVRQISPIYYEVAANYEANRRMIFRRIIIPGSLPMILAGARLALNTALVITIAVELLTAREGLGATIWLAWETLRTEDLYAALAIVALLGIVFNWGLQVIARRMAPWQSAAES